MLERLADMLRAEDVAIAQLNSFARARGGAGRHGRAGQRAATHPGVIRAAVDGDRGDRPQPKSLEGSWSGWPRRTRNGDTPGYAGR